MAVEPIKTPDPIRFGDDFELDAGSYTLRGAGRVLKLERIPMEILLFLVNKRGQLVGREQIVEKIWGREIFLDTDNSINGAIRKIRQVLKDDPEEPRYIQTVTGKGYRFIAPVEEAVAVEGESGEPAEQQPSADPGATAQLEGYGPLVVPRLAVPPGIREPGAERTGHRKVPMIAGAAAILFVLVVSGALWMRKTNRHPESLERPMLAVLPFENFTGDSAQEYFSDGMTEEIISQLGNLDPAHLGVIARTSVMHYKHSQESIADIGKKLGVQYVIEGSVRRDSERVRITAQLIQVKDQSHLWAREYDRDLGHLLELQEEIAREIAGEIQFSLSGQRPIEVIKPAAAPGTGTKSYEAYDLYLKGQYFWNKRTGDGFRQAAGYFQQAIDKDANYGRAYAGLADTFSLMSTWYIGPQNELMPKARAAALRALQLDEHLAEAHAALALIKENYDFDWPAAEKEFRRAIELDPQYPTAHQWYAEFLSWQGRFDDAFAESERARQLDPLSPIIASDHASILYYSRQYDAAVQQWRSVLEMDPNFEHARFQMIPAYLQLGRYDEAIAGTKLWADRDDGPWVWAWEAAIYVRAGRADEARHAVAKLEQLSNYQSGRTPTLLVAYAGIDQKARVIDLLQKAYAEHSNAVVPIKVDPLFDSLRGDPRFKDLLHRIGLDG